MQTCGAPSLSFIVPQAPALGKACVSAKVSRFQATVRDGAGAEADAQYPRMPYWSARPLLAALAALLIQTAFARLGKRDSEPTCQPCPLRRDSDRASHDDYLLVYWGNAMS